MFYIVAITLIGALVLGTSQVAGGVYAGFILFLGMAIIYKSFPLALRKVIVYFRVLVDFTVSTLTFAAVGSSATTSLMAAVTAGILVTLGLHHQQHVLEHKSMLVQDVEALIKAGRSL